MKKIIIILVALLICIMVAIIFFLNNIEAKQKMAKQFNLEYEQYLNKEIYGTDVGTILNKAIDHNETYQIKKDEQGIYIPDDENSIKIEIKFSLNETIYPMETIYKVGTTEFIRNFNTATFKGEVIAYHEKTGKIAEIRFTEI